MTVSAVQTASDAPLTTRVHVSAERMNLFPVSHVRAFSGTRRLHLVPVSEGTENNRNGRSALPTNTASTPSNTASTLLTARRTVLFHDPQANVRSVTTDSIPHANSRLTANCTRTPPSP